MFDATPQKKLCLHIITPDEEVFKGDVDKVSFPGGDGSFQVLYNHAPLVSTLKPGNIYYTNEHKDHAVPISGGVVEIYDNMATVLLMAHASD